MSKPSTETVTVQYATHDGTAVAPGDYTAGTGTVTFAPGVTSMNVVVPTLTDAVYDPNETFSVVLASPTNASIAHDTGLGTILDNAVIDLSLVEVISDMTPKVGDIVTLTVMLSNAPGLAEATGVSVNVHMGAGLEFMSSNPSRGSYSSATGRWTVGSVSSGETVTLEINARVRATGPYTTSAEVETADEPDVDSVPANAAVIHEDDDGAVRFVPLVPQADLAIEKTVSNARPTVGDFIDFSITVRNVGPDDDTGVVVTDGLPAGLRYVTDDGAGSYDGTTGRWTVGALAAGDAVSLRITALVEQAALGTTMTNVAETTGSDLVDPNAANNHASVDVAVDAADLLVTKTVDNPTPAEGDTVEFTITLTNLGPTTALGIWVSDVLPAGLTYVGHSGNGVYDSTLGTWMLGALTDGRSASLTVTATVNAGTAGSRISNLAEVVRSSLPDPDPTNNTAVADVQVTTATGGGGGSAQGSVCSGKVVINEVAWAGTAVDPESQWIELRNIGTAPVDLTGWTLRWRKKVPVTQDDYRWREVHLSGVVQGAIASACELALKQKTADIEFVKRNADAVSWLVVGKSEQDDGSYLLLERKSDETVSNVKADIVYDTAQPYTLDLSPDGDIMQLVDNSGGVVDTANAYEPVQNGWPSGDATTFATMERTDPLAPDTAGNWHTNIGVITRGEDETGRPLVATARAMNSEPLDEWTLFADVLQPTQIVAGAQLGVQLALTQADRLAAGWPWIRVTQLAADSAGGGAALEQPSQYMFSGRTAQDTYTLGIDTTGMAAGEHLVWIVFGEGKAVLVPITILP